MRELAVCPGTGSSLGWGLRVLVQQGWNIKLDKQEFTDRGHFLGF